MNKKDYIWLERHTEINNTCYSVEECQQADLSLKFFRPNHLKKLQQIFKNYPLSLHKDADNTPFVKVINFSLYDFDNIAFKNNAQLILNKTDGKTYYIPSNKNALHRIVRQNSAQKLSQLSNQKKLTLLFSFSQYFFPSEQSEKNSNDFLEKNSEKFLALLQLKISADFMEYEKRKVRLIVNKLSKEPNIQENLNNFQLLPNSKKAEILHKVSEICAEYNRIDKPTLCFLSTKQINKDINLADWIDTEGYTFEKNVIINKDKIKKYDGLRAIALAFHETTHVAQAYSDYEKYPEMEEMFSHKLDYLENNSETYIFSPQELVTYNLEKYFFEECIKQIRVKNIAPKDNSDYTPEYNVATQYMAKSIARQY